MENRPNYVGTWQDTDRPTNNFTFYVFISSRVAGGTMSGSIEDALGISGFIGDINKGHVRFTKIYHEGDEIPIEYFGKRNEDKYIGTWARNNSQKGTFTLENCSETTPLEEFKAKLKEERRIIERR